LKYEIIIIGGGPAGLTTAIQLKRFGYKPLLIEKKELGGLLRNAGEVQNYLGFSNGPTGKELVSDFVEQYNKHNIETKYENVTILDYVDETFVVKTSSNTYFADIVIVASGTKAKVHPKCDGSLNCIRTEVSDLEHLSDKSVLVVGAGDAAFDYALTLSDKNKVFIVNRGKEIKALDLLKEKVFENEAINYMDETRLEDLKYSDDERVSVCLSSSTSRDKRLEVDYVVNAIGRDPARDFFSNKLIKDEQVLIDDRKLFLIGDVKNALFRQVAISSGDGLKTAMEINNILRKEKTQ
jgi:thioredoxin reductase